MDEIRLTPGFIDSFKVLVLHCALESAWIKDRFFQGSYVRPEDFRELWRFSDLTRKQAADLLSVSVRTVQNWETGGARIPWMTYRMLRILKGYALPGKAWEGSSLRVDRLYEPNGHRCQANSFEQIERIFSMARL